MKKLFLIFLLVSGIKLIAQKIEEINIPEGIVYQYCKPKLFEKAKKLIINELSEDPDYSICSDIMIIGPTLWSRFEKVDALDNIEGGTLLLLVDDKQLPGKFTQEIEDSKKVWNELRKELKGEKYILRKANTTELIYYWSIISFDIKEPLIIIETEKRNYILDFLSESMKLNWLEEVPSYLTKEAETYRAKTIPRESETQQVQNNTKVSNPNNITEQELEKVKQIAGNLGMWAPMIVYGDANNIVCISCNESAVKSLSELNISEYTDLFNCNKNIDYDEADKVIEDIAIKLSEIFDSDIGDYYRIMSYNTAAQFYITFAKDETDKTVILASILLTTIEMENAVKAAERIGLETSIVSSGFKILDYIKSLEIVDSLDTDAVFDKLFNWRKDALDNAKNIILK